VLDLRGADELAGQPHPLAGPGTAVHALPLLDQHITAGPHSVDWSKVPDLATAYRGFLLRGAARLATIAELVVAADGPVLVHCTAGKDRTGVAVAVLLRAAGVSRAEVLRDYRRTEPELPAILARAAHLTLGMDSTHVQRLMGVPRDAMTGVLDLLDETPDGAAGWLRAHGVPEQVLDAWQRRLVG
jgi:protein-tyrosine phosphatase